MFDTQKKISPVLNDFEVHTSRSTLTVGTDETYGTDGFKL